MRIAAAAAILCLASCAGALSQSTPPPSNLACADSGTHSDTMCAWRAVNASRAPGAFLGYYRAAAPELDAELAIVEDSPDQVFVAVNYRIGQQGCTARFEGRRAADELVLAPAAELAIPGAACSVRLQRGAASDEVLFSMQQDCSSACRANVSSEEVAFHIADPPHD